MESPGEGWDLTAEVLRSAASVAWLAEEAARRVDGTSFVHEQAQTWHDGEIDEVAVVSNALVALEEAVERLKAFMPSWNMTGTPGERWDVGDDGVIHPIDHDDPDPVHFTGSEGWDFAMWMTTKIGPLTSSLDSSRHLWQVLLQQGPTFFDEQLGKSFEVKPEVASSLHTVAHYAARIAEALVDQRVRGAQ